RFALLDERDVPPGVRAQATGVVVRHPGEVEPVVGDAVPFLAGDLAGLTTDAHAGVGEEPVPRTWILVTGLEVGHRGSPQAFAAPATASATAGTRRSSNTLGTIFLGSASTVSASACAAASSIDVVTRWAPESSKPRNMPGNARMLLIWLGSPLRPVATISACAAAASGSTSGSGLASANTIARLFMRWMSAGSRRFPVLTPMKTSVAAKASVRLPVSSWELVCSASQ